MEKMERAYSGKLSTTSLFLLEINRQGHERFCAIISYQKG
jgi:hypothetical protein